MCVGFPGRVVAVDPAGAIVETDGRRRRASTFLLPDAAVGDFVTVAAGTIVERLRPADAAEIERLLRDAMDRHGRAGTAGRRPTTHPIPDPGRSP